MQLPSPAAVQAAQQCLISGEESFTGSVFQLLPTSSGYGKEPVASSRSPAGRQGRGRGGMEGGREATPAEEVATPTECPHLD